MARSQPCCDYGPTASLKEDHPEEKPTAEAVFWNFEKQSRNSGLR
jgi:hypothetical protein